jgi:hypothetical protein
MYKMWWLIDARTFWRRWYRVYSLISLNSVKFHLFPSTTGIWHRNLLDITTDVHSIMKVKEYRFHVPIYHIFWELQVTELPECIEKDGVNCRDRACFPDHYGCTFHTVKSVGGAIPTSSRNSLTRGFRRFTKDSQTWQSPMALVWVNRLQKPLERTCSCGDDKF